MPLPPQPSPPAILRPAPTGQDADNALLEAFDWGQALPVPPKLRGPAAVHYRWLRAAASFDPAHGLPADPFAAGRGREEAEALRRLLRAPKNQVGRALKALSIHESGTALALWRWGRVQVRQGRFDGELRRIWENRLLVAGPGMTRGYALRHALCWALAEQDEARFADLRSSVDSTSEGILTDFQRLFGLLGGPSPVLRLWALPALDYHDLRLDQLTGSRTWICPVEGAALPELPADTSWIIPSTSGGLDEREANLSGPPLAEGKALAERLRAAGRTAFFAPSRTAFEALGLAWFPILIDLDPKGGIRAIRMGDAAPERP
jgi:hypothetical protein